MNVDRARLREMLEAGHGERLAGELDAEYLARVVGMAVRAGAVVGLCGDSDLHRRVVALPIAGDPPSMILAFPAVGAGHLTIAGAPVRVDHLLPADGDLDGDLLALVLSHLLLQLSQTAQAALSARFVGPPDASG